ncbi:MAG: YopX family protein [Hyphomicrobium sp.]|uniref:YopX family protein n=1 Tax=Hyphomicrobium sp. TaxID=82 RepID=UPI0013223E6D|nr:YopX family protein [Hyphomicrobium sp.]KAB2942905.1 MAG: hypothetical protein F9K20_05395 [Hyphomicrobium sp.]MBZ0208225.1 YopX family protein [Hyphomicrobium sp.]
MREIKFRAWDKRQLKMLTVLQVMFGTPHNLVQAHDGRLPLEVQNTTDLELMQFTGLKDKNGTDIYEGDILEEDADWWRVEYTDRAMFEAIGINGGVDFCLEEIAGSATVQGNIYKNPELLGRS